jgi:hypothetical protein
LPRQTSLLGGKHAYSGRLEKDRRPGETAIHCERQTAFTAWSGPCALNRHPTAIAGILFGLDSHRDAVMGRPERKLLR